MVFFEQGAIAILQTVIFKGSAPFQFSKGNAGWSCERRWFLYQMGKSNGMGLEEGAEHNL